MCSGASWTTFSLVMQETGSYNKHLDSLLRRPKKRENNTFRRWASLCSTFISFPNSPSSVASPQCRSAAPHPASVNLQVLQPFPLPPHPQTDWKAFLFGRCVRSQAVASLCLALYDRKRKPGAAATLPATASGAAIASAVSTSGQTTWSPPCTRSNFLLRLGRTATGACGCGYRRRPGRALMVRSPSRHWPGFIFLDEGSLKLLAHVSPTKLLTNLKWWHLGLLLAFLTSWNSKHCQLLVPLSVFPLTTQEGCKRKMYVYFVSDKGYRGHPTIWKENKISSWLVPFLAELFLETCSFSVLFYQRPRENVRKKRERQEWITINS